MDTGEKGVLFEMKYCKSVYCWGEDKNIGSCVSLISLRCLFQSLGQPLNNSENIV